MANAKNKETAPETQSKVNEAALDNAAPEVATDEQMKSPVAVGNPALAGQAETPAESPGPELKTVSDWGAEMRLAGWQLAMTTRAMGWTSDKAVTMAEMKAAVAMAMSRPQGGM